MCMTHMSVSVTLYHFCMHAGTVLKSVQRLVLHGASAVAKHFSKELSRPHGEGIHYEVNMKMLTRRHPINKEEVYR